MKQGNSKVAYVAIAVIVLVTLCIGLVVMTAAGEKKGNVATMAGGAETEPLSTETELVSETEAQTETEPETETETETEAETEPEPVDLSSRGLDFVSNGDGTCFVSGIGRCRDSAIIFPRVSPDGDRVVGIGEYAFRNCAGVRTVVLHEEIGYVGAYAFYGSGLTTVSLGAGVLYIGDYAFCSCASLRDILVDDANPVYSDTDGVLCSKDGSVIIACPQGKRVNSFSVPAEVTEIKTMAFYNCDTIKLVTYEGGAEAFRKLRIGAGNQPIEGAFVSFGDSGALPSGVVTEK